MNVYKNVHELIGRTPVVELTAFSLPNEVRLFAKLEFMNPGGSVKDRLGEYLLMDALSTGKVKKGGTIIEPTAGNTGIGLALAAVGRDVNVIFCVPEKFSMEKQTLMRALGARVVNTPTSAGMKGAIQKAQELLKSIPGAYCPQQFGNPANPRTYYETLAPEVYQQMNGKIDIFIAGAGTGGTFMGTAEYLKEQNPSIKTVIVEPEGSVINGGKSGPHKTEGIGMEFLPDYMKREFFDAIHTISDRDAFEAVKQLTKKEGLLVASSSGAAFKAAQLEAEVAPKGAHILTIFPDSSERYLSQNIYEGVE